MENKEVLLKFISADSVEEIFDLLTNPNFSTNIKWIALGNDATNLSTAGNQQEDPINALVEKPINSIDHLLIKECRLAGIDPEGSDAPGNMKEAVKKFFKITDGDILNADNKKRRELSENIRIIASGSSKNPSISIVDFGEGQHPSDFSETLLSLPRGKSEKNERKSY